MVNGHPEFATSPPRHEAGDLILAEALDMRAAAPLLVALRQRRGETLRLDGSSVERLGALCLQVILAAQAAWATDGNAFEIYNPSTALTDTWSLMGADPLPRSAPSEFTS